MSAIKNPWPVTKEIQNHMAMRLKQNRERGMTKAERWMFEDYLSKSGLTWKHQRQWGVRIFDFFCFFLGVAVEVDGPEHDLAKEVKRDGIAWDVSRIVVIRVRNWNRMDAADCLERLKSMQTWKARRLEAGMGPAYGKGTEKRLAREYREALSPTPPSPPKPKKIKGCKHEETLVKPQQFVTGKIHYREECTRCSKLVRYLPKKKGQMRTWS